MTQQRGRVDQLAVNVIAHLIRMHCPDIAPVWDNGLGSLAAHFAPRFLPSQPVQSIRIGQMDVPMDLAASFLRAVKLLPEGPRAGA